MTTTVLLALIFLVALVYASVGHGGASGYLAAMSLLAYDPSRMSSAALVLNLFVAGTACWTFWQAGHGSLRLLAPFAVTSVPAAFLGGRMRIPSHEYGWLLAFALLAAALRLLMPVRADDKPVRAPSWIAAGAVGGAIGWISGGVGVGGGIFLSPLMVLLHWADVKQTAAISSAFILVNSLSGLTARASVGTLHLERLLPSVIAALAGGLIGAHFGAWRASSNGLRRLLAMVLAIAAAKQVVSHG